MLHQLSRQNQQIQPAGLADLTNLISQTVRQPEKQTNYLSKLDKARKALCMHAYLSIQQAYMCLPAICKLAI